MYDGLDTDDLLDLLLGVEEQASLACLPDPRSILHPAQLAVYDCDAQERAFLGGRRVGKSVLLGALAFEAAQRFPRDPDVVVTYITRTKSNARRDVWPVLKLIMRWLGYDNRVKRTHEGMLEICPVPGGARIVLGGCETLADVELWRGTKIARAIIDECGAFPSAVLEQLCIVLEPGLADLGGDIVKAGNPGYVFDSKSHWFRLTGHLRASGDLEPATSVPVYHGNMFDNPYMLGGDADKLAEFASKIREKNGWTEQSATYQREWYPGKWVQDDSELVYPFEPGRNGVDELPYPVDHSGWSWCIGVDVGHVEETGIVVLGAHKWDPHEYQTHGEKESGMLTSRLAERVRDLQGQFPGAVVVVDTGGMGKQHAAELSSRFGIECIAADKRDRESNVRITHEAFLSGSMKVLNGPACDVVRDEDSRLRWNEAHTDHDKTQQDPRTRKKMDHCADARLYAKQWLYHHVWCVEPARPRKGSIEYYRQQEEALMREMEARYAPQPEDDWWDA